MRIAERYGKPGAIVIEGHVQGLSNTRSLGEIGIPVIVLDRTSCLARYSKYCSRFFRCPDFILDDFADFLVTLAESEKIRGWLLLPSNDHAVITISRHKTRLEEYYKVTTPGIGILQNIYDKSELLKVANAVAIPAPPTFYLDSLDDEAIARLPYPVITRGRNGLSFFKSMGRKAFMATGELELREQLTQISAKIDIADTLTQEVIPFDGSNHTVSFTAFCMNGDIKTFWMGIKFREHPPKFGTATLCRSVLINELIEPSERLVRALNYTGVCEIEYLRHPSDNEYRLIEMNARTWLWVGLAKACGIDYAKMLYSFVNGEPVSFPGSYRVGLGWINRVTDTLIVLKSLLNGSLRLNDWFFSLRGKKVSAVFNAKDPLPALLFPLIGIALARRRKFIT